MDSFDLVRVRDVWRRLFDMDVEKKRRAAGLVPVGFNLRQLETRYPETQLVDQLLAEIEAENRLLVETETEAPAKRKAQKGHRLPESKDPGIAAGDVFRIFGNGARTILTEADWQGIPETDRQAILEEATCWVFNAGVFFNEGQWHRAVAVPGKWESDGRTYGEGTISKAMGGR
jgi:hypothetical protein